MSSCHDPSSVATVPRPALASNGRARRLVAVVGPPNSGKSTLFNRLTGLRQKVANYPGVTVEKRTGLARLAHGHSVELIDLPGIYSLHPRSDDEQVTHDVLTGCADGLSRPDAIILILDSTTLQRHLALAGPIIALGLPTLVVLNMADELKARGGEMDANALAERIGAPVALISARRGQGIDAVEEFLEGTLGVPPPVQLPILQDVARCRDWAAGVGHQAGYRAPAPPALDPPAGRNLLASGGRPGDLRRSWSSPSFKASSPPPRR